MSQWPLQRDCNAFYGNPSDPDDPSKPNPQWEAENLVFITPPFKMYYAGKEVKRIRFHKKCADAMLGVLNSLNKAADGDQGVLDNWGVSIFGGSYNYRLMRGGNSLSMHSWGCAIDLDPARNALGNNRPRFAMYPQVLKAFEDEGAIWGGDWNGNKDTLDERSCDGMHWQFARLK